MTYGIEFLHVMETVKISGHLASLLIPKKKGVFCLFDQITNRDVAVCDFHSMVMSQKIKRSHGIWYYTITTFIIIIIISWNDS